MFGGLSGRSMGLRLTPGEGGSGLDRDDDMGGLGRPRAFDARGGDQHVDRRASAGAVWAGRRGGRRVAGRACRVRCGRSMRPARPGSGWRGRRAAGIAMQVVRAGQDAAGGGRSGQDRPQGRRAARAVAAGRAAAARSTVPPDWLEAVPASGARAASRSARDLVRARHRVSKLLLVDGRVYPEPTTWNQRHRRWLARQQFEQPADRAGVRRPARRRRRADRAPRRAG